MKTIVVIDGKSYRLPEYIGQRCPRCHRPAPRLDGIPCKLCSPTCGTLTDPKTGITHAYKGGCNDEIDLMGIKAKHFNIGAVPVTCFECIAVTVNGFQEALMKYATDDAKNVIDAVMQCRASGLV